MEADPASGGGAVAAAGGGWRYSCTCRDFEFAAQSDRGACKHLLVVALAGLLFPVRDAACVDALLHPGVWWCKGRVQSPSSVLADRRCSGCGSGCRLVDPAPLPLSHAGRRLRGGGADAPYDPLFCRRDTLAAERQTERDGGQSGGG